MDYQGELFISCWNRSSEPYKISADERIAQLILVPIVQAEFETVLSFTSTERGTNGFGSTGTK